ncbi:MAG: RcnB family protein [Variovorax sp.]
MMIVKSMSMAVAAAALAMCMAGSAFADDRRADRERRNERLEQRRERQQQRQSERQFERHGSGNQFHGQQDVRPGRHFDRSGYPHARNEGRRGGRVPAEYRGRNYVVNDWRGHRLHAPQRGQQWVSVGGDYELAAIATGLIVQIIAGQ